MDVASPAIEEATVAFQVIVPCSFEDAVARCRDELPKEGFGILTEIDLQAKFREKLGRETPPNLILGACHPPSALRAVTAVPEVAVMLPCNVTIAVEGGGTVVRAMNPVAAMRMFASADLAEVADDVAGRLRRALERVAAPR